VKGQAGLDMLTVIVVLFFLLLLGIIGVKVWNGMNAQFQGNSALPAASQTASATVTTNFPAGLDTAIIVSLGLLYIGLFITSQRIGTNPMFFFINVCLLVLVLGFTAILSNAYQSAVNIPQFATEVASMPASVFIGSHLLEFAIGGMAIALIGYFAKPGGAGV